MKKLFFIAVTMIANSAFAAAKAPAVFDFAYIEGGKTNTFIECEVKADGSISATYLDGMQDPGISTSTNDSRLQYLDDVNAKKAAIREYTKSAKAGADEVHTIRINGSVVFQKLVQGDNTVYEKTEDRGVSQIVDGIYDACLDVIESNRFQSLMNDRY